MRPRYDREAEVRLLREDGADPEVLAERKEADGELFNSDLSNVLSPEQLETFWNGILGRSDGKSRSRAESED